ncbi:hypothetical protein GCM10023321_54220 [Pseudonocardia eucalypti]|uniref:GatB/YqeY domain-containing protein n=1 Tax=Pseudonocardia eucalypti TaxID=648755 RepID=A0ABP9QNL3_9PSEU|nr:uncharacterized protein YqeY [Pseudonocardia eucalypti]
MLTELRQGLTVALKSRDRVAAAALRSALAAIENAQAVPVDTDGPTKPVGNEHVAGAVAGLGAAEAERRRLTDEDLRAILAREVGERHAAAEEYEGLRRRDAADRLRAEADVLVRYLHAPQPPGG